MFARTYYDSCFCLLSVKVLSQRECCFGGASVVWCDVTVEFRLRYKAATLSCVFERKQECPIPAIIVIC